MEEMKINYHYMNHCDMRCSFCFGQMNTEYDSNQIMDTFINLTKITCSINLAGGEIFTDLDLLYRMVKEGVRRRVSLSIITNGLILSQTLESEKTQYIIAHVKQLGVSVDSLNHSTNLHTGRASQKRTLTKSGLKKIANACRRHHTLFKINTVVTQHNIEENLGEQFNDITPDKWKILEVVSDDPKIKVSPDVFETFIQNNKKNHPISIEYSKNIQKSYIMVNSSGTLYYNGAHIDALNVNDIRTVYRGQATKAFKKLLSQQFDLNLYGDRYNNADQPLYFDKRRYSKTLGHYVNNQDRPIMLLDIEAINPRPYQLQKHSWLNGNQIPVLYTGMVVNSKMEKEDVFSDYLEPGTKLSNVIEPSDRSDYQRFFAGFVKKLFDLNPSVIVASNSDTEKHFLMDCIYYCNFSREEYDRLQKYMDTMVDIQSVAKNRIIDLDTKRTASRHVLSYLNESRRDLFYYTRMEEKNGKSSGGVSNDLLKIYTKHATKDQDLLNLKLESIEDYCFKDVCDDYELLFSYELINRAFGEPLNQIRDMGEEANDRE